MCLRMPAGPGRSRNHLWFLKRPGTCERLFESNSIQGFGSKLAVTRADKLKAVLGKHEIPHEVAEAISESASKSPRLFRKQLRAEQGSASSEALQVRRER